MKIAIDGRELLPRPATGIATYLKLLLSSEEVAGSGHSFFLFLNQHCSFSPRHPNIEIIAKNEHMTRVYDQFAIPLLLKATGAELLFSPYPKLPLLRPCPAVITIHDLIPLVYPGYKNSVKSRLLRAAYKIYARSAELILADSQCSKRDAVSELGAVEEKIEVVYLAPDDLFEPIADAEKVSKAKDKCGIKGEFIFTIGNFKPHKNLKTLIQAFSCLPADVREGLQLVLAGGHDEYWPGIKKFAQSKGLSEAVLFPGYVEEALLPSLYSCAALFVYPSLYEGFGLPIIEAMACGAPVLASPSASIPEVAGDAALYFDPASPDDLARKMLKVLTDKGLRADLAARSLQRARSFSKKGFAGKLIGLFEKAAKKG